MGKIGVFAFQAARDRRITRRSGAWSGASDGGDGLEGKIRCPCQTLRRLARQEPSGNNDRDRVFPGLRTQLSPRVPDMKFNRDGRNSEERRNPLWPFTHGKLLQALDFAVRQVFRFKVIRFNVGQSVSSAPPNLHISFSLTEGFPKGMTNFGYAVDCTGAGATFDWTIEEIFIVIF